MTRISSFGLYECPNCAQIHIKPEYGSISIQAPLVTFLEPSDIKICQGCSWKGQFQQFKYLGLRSKIKTNEPTKIELWMRRLLKKPYVELDVRKLYPYIN